MNHPLEQACDSQRIDDYLNETLSSSQQSEFETHLSRCEWCRQQLQSRAAEPELWLDAAELLHQPPALMTGRAPTREQQLPQSSEGSAGGLQSQLVQSVLGALSPTDDPEMLGRIDDYEIIGVVGLGGMGAVLKGFDKSLRRVVAIKIMAPHLAGSGSARTRFQREARAAAAVTHDNVIDIYGVSETGGLPYLVMPYARGPSLQKRIDDGGPLSVAEVLRIGRQIAAGLTAAHEQGLVHRDIKPANILLNDGIERLLITDFGVARAMDDASMTRTGLIAGTPQYMSPEQARGEVVDHRSDLFSLGSVLYAACTGRPPFRSEAAYGMLRRITDDDPRPIREINPDIPSWLCRVVDRLMAKHPADRFHNAAEVSELLEGCLAHLQQPTQVELPRSLTSSSALDALVAQSRRRPRGGDSRSRILFRIGGWLMISTLLCGALGLLTLQATGPADIAGRWQGEAWPTVSLSSVQEAANWYTGVFTDVDGQQGALQLEWSRLQRRYNGRWKSSDGRGGAITLPPAPVAPCEGRFRWILTPKSRPTLLDCGSSRGVAFLRAARLPQGKAMGAGPVPGTRRAALAVGETHDRAAPQVIESPTAGVVQWGEGIHENAAVKKGDLIAEIRSPDPAELRMLERQQAQASQHVSDTELVVAAAKRKLEAAQRIAESLEPQVRAYEAVKEQIATAAQAAVDSVLSKVEAEQQQLVADRAASGQLKAEFERMKAIYEEGLASAQKFQQVERACLEAVAKAQKSQANLEAVKHDAAEKQNEGLAKVAKTQADIEYAKTQLEKARAEVSEAETQVAHALAELEKAQAELAHGRFESARQPTTPIAAPDDGHVFGLTGQRMLNQGDPICKLTRQPADQKLNPQESGSPPEPSRTAPPLASPAAAGAASAPVEDSIAQTFGTVSDLARRLRDSRAEIESLKSKLAAAESDIQAAAKRALAIQAEIAEAQQQADPDPGGAGEARVASDRRLQQLAQRLQAEQLASGAGKQLKAAVLHSIEIQRLHLADAEAERSTIIQLLQSQLEAAESQLQLQQHVVDATRRRFQLAFDGVVRDDILRAEQAVAGTQAKTQQLELLLKLYLSLAAEPEPSEPEPSEPEPSEPEPSEPEPSEPDSAALSPPVEEAAN